MDNPKHETLEELLESVGLREASPEEVGAEELRQYMVDLLDYRDQVAARIRLLVGELRTNEAEMWETARILDAWEGTHHWKRVVGARLRNENH